MTSTENIEVRLDVIYTVIRQGRPQVRWGGGHTGVKYNFYKLQLFYNFHLKRRQKNALELGKRGFLHIWHFNPLIHLIKLKSTLSLAFFFKNMIFSFHQFLHYLYLALLCRCSVRF